MILLGDAGFQTGPSPSDSVIKKLPEMQETQETGSIPGAGRSPGGWHGNPLQYPCLENSMDGGVWQATVHRVTESDVTEVT